MKLNISNGSDEWEATALDANAPNFEFDFLEQMMLYGHCYVYRTHPQQDRKIEAEHPIVAPYPPFGGVTT